MNNYQWLLQMDGADRKAWFDAEHIENQERAAESDTEPENADSRDKLEADVRKIVEAYNMDTQRHGTERFAHELFYSIIHLLDRQAAITSHQWESYHNGMMSEWMAKTEELQAEVDELQEKLRIGWECECKLQAERERYRKLFGMALDWAHEITMLESSVDEGLA